MIRDLSTGYTVFEDDQVLTAGQLNGVTRYLDDESHKTRIGLLGVGIVCGLRVSWDGDVVLSKGTALTTHGDLVWIPQDIRFGSFKEYPDTAPRYAPFYTGETRIKLFELVRKEGSDPRATPLNQFEGRLGLMVAILLVESYEKDEDLCSGTDCDNLGRQAVSSIKLLLTDQPSAELLVGRISTLGREARALPDIVADRPQITSVGSFKSLAAIYRKHCLPIHNGLVRALDSLFQSPFLLDLLPPEGSGPWRDKLTGFGALFKTRDVGIQYYYDFLTNLVETYTVLRELLLGIDAVCCPDVDAFSKHLVLGRLAAGETELRTGFYPSPLVGSSAEQWAHARFLAARLLAMIEHFKAPEGGAPAVRITPSHFKDRDPEERAIPYYYDGAAIHNRWSYALEKRGMSAWCYSYHAPDYGAQGGAARPLETQAGRFPFFFIEGFLNAPVDTVKTALENEIRSKNLPFAVRAILVGSGTIAVPPPPDYTAMHQFHYLLRQDLAYQLQEAEEFGKRFRNQVYTAVDTELVPNSRVSSGTWTYKGLAEDKSAALTAAVPQALDTLNLGYTEYRRNPGWTEFAQNALTVSGEFKYYLGDIAKTDFPTPIDTLIGSSRPHWLGWLDQIIEQKEETRKDELLFNNFLVQHPGLEHFAGVVWGGTFVLVYEPSGRVVADFMLPYRCCEPVQAPPPEPPLPPPHRPDWVLDNGLNIQPSREQVVTEHIYEFQQEIEPRFNLQNEYFNVFERSVNMAGDIYTNARIAPPTNPDPGDWQDRFLELLVQQAQVGVRKIRHWLERNKEERTFEIQQKSAEQELARTIEETTRYVAESRLDVSPGSEGYRAMTAVSEHSLRLTDKEAVAALRDNLSKIEASPALAKLISAILRRK